MQLCRARLRDSLGEMVSGTKHVRELDTNAISQKILPHSSSVQDGEVTIVMQWCTRLMKSSECICTYTTMIGKVSILPDILLASNIN